MPGRLSSLIGRFEQQSQNHDTKGCDSNGTILPPLGIRHAQRPSHDRSKKNRTSRRRNSNQSSASQRQSQSSASSLSTHRSSKHSHQRVYSPPSYTHQRSPSAITIHSTRIPSPRLPPTHPSLPPTHLPPIHLPPLRAQKPIPPISTTPPPLPPISKLRKNPLLNAKLEETMARTASGQMLLKDGKTTLRALFENERRMKRMSIRVCFCWFVGYT